MTSIDDFDILAKQRTRNTFMEKSETSQFMNPPVNIFVSKNHAIEKDDFCLIKKSNRF